jgi:hypothetical protein
MKNKKITLLLLLVTFWSGNIDAQSARLKKKGRTKFVASTPLDPLSNDTAHFIPTIQPNHSRDTLYLTMGDTISRLTEEIWRMDKNWNGTNPTIVYVSPNTMRRIKSNYMVVVNARITPKKPDGQ